MQSSQAQTPSILLLCHSTGVILILVLQNGTPPGPQPEDGERARKGTLSVEEHDCILSASLPSPPRATLNTGQAGIYGLKLSICVLRFYSYERKGKWILETTRNLFQNNK